MRPHSRELYAAESSTIDSGWRVCNTESTGWVIESRGRRFPARASHHDAAVDADWPNDGLGGEAATPEEALPTATRVQADPLALERSDAAAETGRPHDIVWESRPALGGDAQGLGVERDTREADDAVGARVGSEVVDQIGPRGELLADVDSTLSEPRKDALLLGALPGARVETYAGTRVIRYGDHVLTRAQVTHLGRPWPEFKKRIQIPNRWLGVHSQASADGLTPHFVGIYHYRGVTVFVDFDPETYVKRKANNSAAHLATNDLYQAQVDGLFSRQDRNGNRLTSVRADLFDDYLRGAGARNPRLEVFERFNTEFLSGTRIEALDAIQQMHAVRWPDTFQNEWAGFYLEHRFDRFTRDHGLTHLARFQKSKGATAYDYDIVFPNGDAVAYYGDLKASTLTSSGSQGNDMGRLRRCVNEFGRFWYVVYEHETTLAKTNGHKATIAWNRWRRSVGYHESRRKEYNELSYADKFKESVRFTKMLVLEVNPVNFDVVLGTFKQGPQPDGSARAIKTMINKKVIDNYLVYWATAPGHDEDGGLGDAERLIEE